MIVYIISIILIGVAILYILKNWYNAARDRRLFRNEKFVEGPFFRFYLDGVLPKENSPKYRRIDNKILVITKDSTIRDFYVLKFFTTFAFVSIAILIVLTNIIGGRLDAFKVDSKQPYEISSSVYKTLSKNLDLSKEWKEQDKTLFNENLYNVESQVDVAKMKKIDPEKLYLSIQEIGIRCGNIFSIGDLLVLIVLSIFGWNLPNIGLNMINKYLDSIEIIEFDRLESIIYLNSKMRVPVTIGKLIDSSFAYRELFRIFNQNYTINPDEAYEVFLSQSMLSPDFKKLIRYLQIIDSSSANEVTADIEANKELNKDKLENYTDMLHSKRTGRIVMACMGCIFFSLGRILFIMLTNINFPTM